MYLIVKITTSCTFALKQMHSIIPVLKCLVKSFIKQFYFKFNLQVI